jgi:hypothetical protein
MNSFIKMPIKKVAIPKACAIDIRASHPVSQSLARGEDKEMWRVRGLSARKWKESKRK